MSPLLFGAVIVLALLLAYVNGFHDASNAVSTAITTRTLPESTALAMAALLNVLGGLLGMAMITATAAWAVPLLGMGSLLEGTAGRPDELGVVLVAILASTILWDLVTWWFGAPASTWHAFLFSVVGASLAVASTADWSRLAALVLVSVLVPPVAAGIAFVLMHLVRRLDRADVLRIGHIRFAQTISAGAVATGHGINDSRLPLAVVVVAGSAAGIPPASSPALLVSIAIAVGAGTLMGGHRIIRTLGRRLTDLTTSQGLAAETSSALAMLLSSLVPGTTISTSHTMASSVVGAGLAHGARSVRWTVVREVLVTWASTPVACTFLACAAAAVGLTLVQG